MNIINDLSTWGYLLIKGRRLGVPEFSGCSFHENNLAILPDYDCIPNGQGTFEVQKMSNRCGVAPELGRRIYQFHCELFKQGNMIFFNPRYTDLPSAQQVKRIFFPQDAQWRIYGIGFIDPAVKNIPEYQELPPLPGNGIFLGYDLYGVVENSLFCPFRHCDMENKVPLKMGITLTACGLIANKEDAIKLANYVKVNKQGEPEEDYIPFGIVEYPGREGDK